MKKLIISCVVVLSFIICASAQQSTEAQKIVPAKSVQTNSLSKKTHNNPIPTTNWSRIKDLFK